MSPEEFQAAVQAGLHLLREGRNRLPPQERHDPLLQKMRDHPVADSPSLHLRRQEPIPLLLCESGHP